MNRVTTVARVPAVGKLLPNFYATFSTELRGSCGIDFYNHGTGTLSLVREDHPKVIPANIGYRLGQPVVPQHPTDIEALHREQTIAINQSINNLVVILTSHIANTSMQLGNLGDSLTTLLAALLLARYRTLAPAQFRQLFLKETRISYMLALVRRKEMFQANIDANGRILTRRNAYLAEITRENYVPLAGLQLERGRLNYALVRTMHPGTNHANVLNTQLSLMKTDAITVSRKLDRI